MPTSTPNTIDLTLANQFMEHAKDLVSDSADRINNMNDAEAVFMLDWQTGKPTDPVYASLITIDPDPRNATIGATRLMTASVPTFSVPMDETAPDAGVQSDKIEMWCKAVWAAAGRVRQRPIHNEAVLSAVLLNEIHIGITSTDELLKMAQKSDPNNPRSKSAVARFERLAETTPFMPELYDPRSGFPEYNAYGMSAYYREVKMRAGAILDQWGLAAQEAGLSNSNRKDMPTYADWWDDTYHVVYVNQKPIFMAEHGLPCIPIVAQVVEGSEVLFSKKEYNSQPFLYTIKKSGMWERANLSMTSMYTSIFHLSLAQAIYEKDPSNTNELRPDYSILGGLITINKGETLKAFDKHPVDPIIQQGLSLAEEKMTESTMFKQALGQPLGGGNAPYSAVALMNQVGRLPLVPIQRMCASSFAKALEICLLMVRNNIGGSKIKASNKEGHLEVLELKKADIPDGLTINCNVDIDLPQDDRQNAAVATQLSSGPTPLTSRRWVRESLLHIGQSAMMDKEIAKERYNDMMQQKYFAEQMAAIQRQQQMQAPAQPGSQGQAQQPGLPQTTPEQAAMLTPTQPGPGANQLPPELANLPPELANLPPDQLAQILGQTGGPGGLGQAGLPNMPLAGPLPPRGQP